MRQPRSILITGASSGIGEALAHAYAEPGTFLALSGRNAARLESVAKVCRLKGAETATGVVDVTHRDSMAAWIEKMDAARPLELVIANAGVSGGTGGAGEPADQVERIFEINVGGVVNTVNPAADLMRKRIRTTEGVRGQIAIMSSLSAFRGLASAPAYCASKAAVKHWGEGLRGALHAHGIEVSVVCPGFVRSRMTARNKFFMPMLMDADRAAKIIKRRLEKGRPRIAFPWPVYFTVWLTGALPPRLTEPLLRRTPKKG